MPRINVYVPDDMKERMDALGDRINWSEAAQIAFSREIANATQTSKGDDMEAVVERLRVSKLEFEKSEGERGRKDGHIWATQRASYGDLKRVSDLELVDGNFAQQLDEALGLDESEGNSFWINEKNGRIQFPSNEYVFGFWDEADDVFTEVSQKL